MSEPTKEQIKEFWEKLGFKPKPNVYGSTSWKYPDGLRIDVLPLIDLNNLFLYAVPKLIETRQRTWSDSSPQSVKVAVHLCWCTATPHEESHWRCAIIEPSQTQWKEEALSWAKHKDPALALFWAIWEVIHE